MTLAYPLLERAIRFSENEVPVLIIENKHELRRFVTGLQQQIEGLAGELVLAEGDCVLEASKSAELISDPFSLDFSSRKLLSKINQDACAVGAEYAEEFYFLMEKLNALALNISRGLDYDASCDCVDTWDELIKLMGFHADVDNMSFPERVLEYMKLQRRFFNKKLFVLYNLKACLSSDELRPFYRGIIYEKLSVLLVEDVQREAVSEYENTLIVDKDLCVF